MTTPRPIISDISLVISTYNNVPFLRLVLESVRHLNVYPAEVIIADDGSTEDTTRLIADYATRLPVPLVHSWIEDAGFRLAKSRNVAVARAKGDYIISMDGDMVLHPDFVKDHAALRCPGYFVAGSRARLTPKGTARLVSKIDPRIHVWTRGLRRRLVFWRCPLLHPFVRGRQGLRRARGCHLAFYRDDFIRVNGFEEAFEGWGYEDSEFVQRLYNNGIRRKNAKLMAPAAHLYHVEKMGEQDSPNHRMLQETIRLQKKRADRGVSQYL